jgi:hypothetical protein
MGYDIAVCNHQCLNLLLWLDKSYTTSVSLVHNTNLVGLFVAEDIEIMVNVIESEYSLFDGDCFTQVKADR